ncbi:hypothetical protein RISK_000010 [Rhodopirellula islandica]|uniref:Uncharacterized protein n=1 Tax=Rhodopirellula islandica TaxID=595434 RepID=A0A0J1BMS6_RHOIS|nr:hypothetical protein RISK_000010 [Rhodopirellula islandica]
MPARRPRREGARAGQPDASGCHPLTQRSIARFGWPQNIE